MATIEKRITDTGDLTYRARVRLKGSPSLSATFPKSADAKRWAQQTEAAIREGRHFKTVEARRRTFAELIDRYIKDVLPNKPKQARKQRQQLEYWKAKLGHHTLVDVTPARIVEARDALSRGRSPATVSRYLAALSHVYTIAVNEWQWAEESPLAKVKKPKEARGRVRFLSEDERGRLLEACEASSNAFLYPCVILALSTGMRQGELMNLRWPDVNLKDGFLILHETKNDERRRVPLAGQALRLLQNHARVRRLDTDLLFPAPIKPNQPANLRRPFENALRAARIDNFRWHDLRHCTASYLAMNGASLAEIAEILGHKTLQMVKRYAHLSDGHVSDVVAAMNTKIFG